MPVANDELLIVTPEQKEFFDKNGYVILKSLYSPDEIARMREEFHRLVTETEGRAHNMSYHFMEPVEGYEVDPFNPKNVAGMMDQTLAGDYWFDQFTDPRVVGAMVDLLGPNIDFHNGKIRNKPPGFFCDQSWHQDFPYERHSKPELAAALTYLDDTDFEQGATEVVPSSHLKGEWPTHNGVCIADDLVSDDERVVLSAQAGDVAIIHVLVVHRAGHNYTNQARHAIINEYKTAEAIDQWNNRCAFAGLPLARNRRLIMPRVQSVANGN
ncbi:MAG TPA: phytanoyl-CoA dioxygenase family protein [Abditibacteriaceae bacterium]|nr:phytanoyl-CoA dioxygenase family protein [Abditibacteriaceae bacterium]